MHEEEDSDANSTFFLLPLTCFGLGLAIVSSRKFVAKKSFMRELENNKTNNVRNIATVSNNME
jgi:hypothetical protein